MEWQREIQSDGIVDSRTVELPIYEYERTPAYERAGRYRAQVAFVSPPSRRSSFESETECFLGVSLENRNFEPARFHALLEWIARRFAKCKILIGDSIHRITLETKLGLLAEVALPAALKSGREFIDEHRSLVESYRGTTEFEFVTCQDIQKTSAYAQYSRHIRDYFDRTPEFKDSVEAFGRHYHRSDLDEIGHNRSTYLIRRSCDYFLEEFAIFSCLVKDGNAVMVYPGSFSTLAEIADGVFPTVLPELQALTVVSIKLKRR
ncbi:tRNA-dependent cyclodipeptide synthase [Janthinobacterium sp. PAMC25594]|uniref:tRNA-dependent cyclodipeptide synthase n=1 Tax=Janthinobacterium sp. PAMC25594 TaxID=2861284 RepID=UPI001C63B726|nr:tRNA-dependent cyclodipeptide synthase [Janthinobacterium sp. PAMC25594]QYG08889.1 tRNA-dependent cyclodipeptide synthase [Janthinobacterium sp. PAMC25594]